MVVGLMYEMGGVYLFEKRATTLYEMGIVFAFEIGGNCTIIGDGRLYSCVRWEFYGCLRWEWYVYGIILLTGSKTWMLDSCLR